MLREFVNESRAARGMNGIPTGRAGKGSVYRPDGTPSWVGLEEIGREGGMVSFKTSRGMKYVPEEAVERYYRIHGRK